MASIYSPFCSNFFAVLLARRARTALVLARPGALRSHTFTPTMHTPRIIPPINCPSDPTGYRNADPHVG